MHPCFREAITASKKRKQWKQALANPMAYGSLTFYRNHETSAECLSIWLWQFAFTV